MPDNLNTVYLSTPQQVGNYQKSSGDSTVLSALSISGKLDVYDVDVTNDLAVTADVTANTVDVTTTLGAGASTFSSTVSVAGAATFDSTVTAAGMATLTGGVQTQSIITISATNPLSLETQANFNDMTVGQVRLVFTSSGMSLGVSSGTSLYDIGSNTSGAQPTS